jgi:hypothetical protein
MPTVEKVSGGRVYVREVGREFDRGDRVDVSEVTAAYLCEERGDFERVDAATEDSGSEGAATAEPEPTSTSSDGSFDAGEWLERDYQDRADIVEAGAVDAHLATVLEIETSETVKDAVAERQGA